MENVYDSEVGGKRETIKGREERLRGKTEILDDVWPMDSAGRGISEEKSHQ